MKKHKDIRYILLIIACILALAVLCFGCEKITPYRYDMENYRTPEDASLYSFTEQLTDMECVVATAMYGSDSILIYEEVAEDNTMHKKVWLFSYLTGERKLCSDLEVTMNKDYQVTSHRFSVINAAPLVLCDRYEEKIYIYTEDFSDYSVMAMEDYVMPLGMIVRGDGFYFMDFNTCKVYVHDMKEFKFATRSLNYKTFREESQLIFEPDYNVSSVNLESVSEDGNYLRLFAQNYRDKEYYYYVYNIQTEMYEEMYQFDGKENALWSSWEETKWLSLVVPSAVSRYEMIDCAQKRAYTVKIEPEVIYSIVECDANISDTQDAILFYVVDENKETITGLFLWKYAQSESEPIDLLPEKIRSEIPEEIEYGQLTDKANDLEEKYGINIIMGENVTFEFDAYDYEQVTDEEHIFRALEELERALDAFPEEMCTEMSADYAIGFNIYLCGTFSPKNEDNISDAGAFYIYDEGYYNLAMNIMLDNTEANVIHEMTHAIDDYFRFCGAFEHLEEAWQACNPDGFRYLESYFDYEEEYEYTMNDEYNSPDDIYFLDTYSKTFPGEDRSRIFEFFGSEYWEGDWLLSAEPLRRKARVLMDYCTEHLECFRVDEEYGLKTKAEELGW